MGGSRSEEFLTPAENGEDTYVRCTTCDYAANTEAVQVPVASHCSQVPPQRVRQQTPSVQKLLAHWPSFAQAWPAERRQAPWTHS